MWNALARTVTTTFSKALQPASLNAANWTTRQSNLILPCTTAVALGSVVTSTYGFGDPNPGPNVVNYAPPPADVVGLNALPAAAFSDFPTT